MTFTEWFDSFSNDDQDSLSTRDAWKAGAEAVFEALVSRGYIYNLRDQLDARKEVAAILKGK